MTPFNLSFRSLIVLLCVAVPAVGLAYGEGTAESLSSAEAYVRDMVAAGKVADLKSNFPTESDRVIGASFLEDLLTRTNSNSGRHGVRIIGAIVTNRVDLEDAEVHCPTRLENSIFKAEVNLSRSVFQKTLSFAGSTIKSAGFSDMKVFGAAIFSNTFFSGAVDFRRAEIAGQFRAEGTHFTEPNETATFNAMKVQRTTFFSDAVFAGGADFSYMDIAGVFAADGIHFTNTIRGVIFTSTYVRGGLVCDGGTFCGPASFIDADISGDLSFARVSFSNADAIADFNSIKVGGSANFRDAGFNGPVSFSGADIGIDFYVNPATFSNAQSIAVFNGVKVGRVLFLDDAEFLGGADFAGLDAKLDLSCCRMKFRNNLMIANFNAIKVGRAALFRNAIFNGRANFRRARIGLNLELSGAQFNDATKLPDEEFNADFKGLTAGGVALFDDAVFTGKVSLAHANFAELRLSAKSWPKGEGDVDLDGTQYQHVSAVSGGDTLSELLKIAELSIYSPDVYDHMERYFRDHGTSEQSDQIFIARKVRERETLLENACLTHPGLLLQNLASYVWNFFLYWFVGYGRMPLKAVGWSVLVIFIGAAVFRRKNMQLSRPETRDAEIKMKNYKSILYSVDLFLPIIKLYDAEAFEPRQECPCVLFWMRVQKFLGWALIPIAISAWTGILPR